jgi:anti-sigma factor RsiW
MIHPDELLSAHLDGELTATERETVAAHLLACERCRQELSDLSAARSAVRSLPTLELPVLLATRVGSGQAAVALRRRPSVWIGSAAAVALAVFVGAAALSAPEPQRVAPPELTAVYGAASSNDPALNLVKVAGVTQAANEGMAP